MTHGSEKGWNSEQEEFNARGTKRSLEQITEEIKLIEGKVEAKRKENDDMSKGLKKLERKYKDALVVLEEDRKNLIKQQEEYEHNQIKVWLSTGYIDVGDRCCRRDVLVTTLKYC